MIGGTQANKRAIKNLAHIDPSRKRQRQTVHRAAKELQQANHCRCYETYDLASNAAYASSLPLDCSVSCQSIEFVHENIFPSRYYRPTTRQKAAVVISLKNFRMGWQKSPSTMLILQAHTKETKFQKTNCFGLPRSIIRGILPISCR